MKHKREQLLKVMSDLYGGGDTGGLTESQFRQAIERSDTLAPLEHGYECPCRECQDCEPPIHVTVGARSVDDIEQAAYLMGWSDGHGGDSWTWPWLAFFLGLVVGLFFNLGD